MALSSRSGLWRLPALGIWTLYGSGLKTKNFWLHTPQGAFHCVELASAWQFWPWWEREVKLIISELRDGLFVDVGANIGYYSVMAANHNNRVIAFEPDILAWSCLCDNARVNGVWGNMEIFNMAAWSSDGHLGFKTSRHHDTGRVLPSGFDILGATGDRMLAGRRPDLVKIDAEGSEPYVLMGMQSVVKHHVPIIFEALNSRALANCRALLQDYHIRKLDRTNYYAS